VERPALRHADARGWLYAYQIARCRGTPSAKRVSRSSEMKPTIDHTVFGSITIDGKTFAHDVIIRLNGQVQKRKKKLSKVIYGTSHVMSLAEAKYVYEKGTKRFIVGTGQQGNVTLSEDAADYFERKKCHVQLLPTPKAIRVWNETEGAVISLFHVTC
jgi:hypothetical protein